MFREVYGDAIKNYFRSKHIRDVVCLSGEWDETQFNIFVLKEPDYKCMMMSTFLVFTLPEGQK